MLRIRRYQDGDAKAVARLISKTYAQFNSTEGSPEAVQQYVARYNPDGDFEEIRKRLRRTPCCWVAVDDSRVVGVIRGIGNRLINLFIAGPYQRRGIAARLVRRYEMSRRKAGYSEVVLRSSLYAVPFYQAVGYKKTTGVRTLHGLKVQPMKKRFQ